VTSAISSIEALGWTLWTRPSVLREMADNAVRHYHPYREVTAGKARVIDNPDERIKALQRRILRSLLQRIRLPVELHGAVKGKSPHTNACQHLGRPVVIRIDLRSFFPSVTNTQVYSAWVKYGHCSPTVASILTALTTFHGYLPQGAPTSSAIANLVLLDVDSQIVAEAARRGCNFTRYIDDLVFSGDHPQQLISSATSFLKAAGFRISRRKLSIMPALSSQEVTGLLVNSSFGPSVSRKRRDRIRAAIHQLAQSDEASRDSLSTKIRGRIQYVAQTNPGAAHSLGRRLNALLDRETPETAKPERSASNDWSG
jgi:RNA-directed DNA polymerase